MKATALALLALLGATTFISGCADDPYYRDGYGYYGDRANQRYDARRDPRYFGNGNTREPVYFGNSEDPRYDGRYDPRYNRR
jgi:hypothetical protein